MYAKIAKHPTTFAKYRDDLTASQVMTAVEVEAMDKAFAATLDEAYTTSTSKGYKTPPDMFGGVWEGLSRRPTDEPATGVSTKALEAVSKATLAFPKGFTPHPKVLKTLEKRAETLLKGDMDWGTAEMAAYGTLLQEGFNIRLSGQDAKRGTFSHRHAVLTDSANGAEANPVASVAAKGARFEVINSSLSEEAVMGFEFGYSLADPKTLTIWEAQFGDFANGAQVVIDQFLASSEVKWHRLSGLVLLLPHGYEGQGPEHSSARLERFLQLCAEDNLMVANATTPAQIFHLLRRQVHMDARRPLVVMSPKSLLRHPEAVSATGDLVAGKFQPVILDAAVKPADVTRVVFCSGKLYYDLAATRKDSPEAAKVALVRLEQLYPLPMDGIRKALKTYAKATELVWAQEEPRNMGAWSFLLDHLAPELPKPLMYAGRDRAASPACGSAKRHATEQAAVVAAALDLKTGGK
jgi:2-oxoglutarate dehydrogenase E1 component